MRAWSAPRRCAIPARAPTRRTGLGGPPARTRGGRGRLGEVERVGEGVGRVFNEAGCAPCHAAPVGGTTGRAETRFGKVAGGVFDPMTELGGSLLQDHAIGLVSDGGGSFMFVPEA